METMDESSYSCGPGRNIVTAVRARPLSDDNKKSELWRLHSDLNAVECLRNDSFFLFDKVYSGDPQTKQIFTDLIEPLVDGCVRGINGTVFVYGQTASGKTHTMFGNDTEIGLVYLAIEHMFETIFHRDDRDECMVLLSCVEIYNEMIFDLLSDDLNVVHLKEINGVFKLRNAIEMAIDDVESANEMLSLVADRRRVALTTANQRSSRSHCIIQIRVESHDDADNDDTCVVGVMQLLDLAGSESISLTGDQPTRIRETRTINCSLLQLTSVIRCLSEGARFVNYRSSQLTKLLKASLSGNANVCLLGCIRTDQDRETRNTLQFTQSARAVMVRPRINVVMSNEATLKAYKRQLDRLREQLSQLREQKGDVVSVEKKLRTQLEDEYNSKMLHLQKFLLSSKNGSPVTSRATDPRLNRRNRSWAPTVDTVYPPCQSKKMKLETEEERYSELSNALTGAVCRIESLFTDLQTSIDCLIDAQKQQCELMRSQFENILHECLEIKGSQPEPKERAEVEWVDVGIQVEDDSENREAETISKLLCNPWLRKRGLNP